MKLEIKSFGMRSRIIQSLVILSCCLVLHTSASDFDAFSKAVYDGDVEQVGELLNKNPIFLNGEGKKSTPLCSATLLAHTDVIELLISMGADVDRPTHQNFTPRGAEDPMPKPLSVTPLHLAAYQGFADVAMILLAAKADPMAKREDNTTPLHTAAEYDRTEVVKVLIAANVDVNARDMDGATPLHYAAGGTTSLQTLAALVAGGSDMNLKAEKGEFAGKTPLEIRESLTRFATLAPDWGKSDIDIPKHLKNEFQMLKYMTYALRSFSDKHGSYPTDQTALTLEKSFKDTVRLRGDAANDYFRQLLFTTDFPDSVGASATGSAVIGKSDWEYSYVLGGAFNDNPDRPVLLVPLMDGERRFDTKALGGKAVILFADCNVRHFPIESDGRVLINEMDIFDPKQPFWKNSKPEIKWPRPPKR